MRNIFALRHRPHYFIIFGLAFASLGTALLILTKAATVNADFNNDSTVNVLDLSILATNYNKSGQTQPQGDANGDGTVNVLDLSVLATQWNTNPGGGGGTASFCSSFPALPGAKPDSTNTGVPAGTSLTAYSGSSDVTVDGTVIDAKDITSRVDIYANNVTIKNSKIHPATSASVMGVYVHSGYTGLKILNSEIYTTGGGYIGVYGGDTTVCGSYLHGWENAMDIENNMIIQANYIDKSIGVDDVNAHHDGIEIYGSNNVKIWGNNIRLTNSSGNWLTETGAINLTAYFGNVSNLELNGNWLGGGGYTMYITDGNGKTTNNVSVTNNTWYKNSYQWGPLNLGSQSMLSQWTNNKLDDGTTLSP